MQLNINQRPNYQANQHVRKRINNNQQRKAKNSYINKKEQSVISNNASTIKRKRGRPRKVKPNQGNGCDYPQKESFPSYNDNNGCLSSVNNNEDSDDDKKNKMPNLRLNNEINKDSNNSHDIPQNSNDNKILIENTFKKLIDDDKNCDKCAEFLENFKSICFGTYKYIQKYENVIKNLNSHDKRKGAENEDERMDEENN